MEGGAGQQAERERQHQGSVHDGMLSHAALPPAGMGHAPHERVGGGAGRSEILILELEPTMPIYEYRCRDCGHRFEVLQRMGQGPEGLVCPRCGVEALDKQYSTFAS
ncbi:MAG TPA: zinc ribbon domain-containing protein, partial [Thermoanaerobaculia bacterium]